MFIGDPTKWTTEPQRFAEDGDVLISVRAPVGPVNLTTQRVCIGRGLAAIRPRATRLLTHYTFYVLRILESEITGSAGAAFASINKTDIEKIEIPLPPLEVQQEIVAEIENYQRVIDGARAVVENWRPQIAIESEWPVVAIGDVCDSILSGGTPSTKNEEYWKSDIPWITSADIVNIRAAQPRKYITDKAIRQSATNLIPRENIIVATRVGLGKLFKNELDVCISQDSQGLIIKNEINADYLVYILRDRVANFKNVSQGSTIQGVTKKQLSELQIPLPPLETQQAIVAEIEAERAIVPANRELVERMEEKIRTAIGRVWNKNNNVPISNAKAIA